jgi:hypothetical protein
MVQHKTVFVKQCIIAWTRGSNSVQSCIVTCHTQTATSYANNINSYKCFLILLYCTFIHLVAKPNTNNIFLKVQLFCNLCYFFTWWSRLHSKISFQWSLFWSSNRSPFTFLFVSKSAICSGMSLGMMDHHNNVSHGLSHNHHQMYPPVYSHPNSMSGHNGFPNHHPVHHPTCFINCCEDCLEISTAANTSARVSRPSSKKFPWKRKKGFSKFNYKWRFIPSDNIYL